MKKSKKERISVDNINKNNDSNGNSTSYSNNDDNFLYCAFRFIVYFIIFMYIKRICKVIHFISK